MTNVQEPRATRSAVNSPDTTITASSLERISDNSTNFLFRTVNKNQGLTRQNVQDDVETLAHALGSTDEDFPLVPVQGQGPTPAPPSPTLELFGNKNLRAMMLQKVHEVAERIYISRVKEVK